MAKRPIKKKQSPEEVGLQVKNLGKTYGNKPAVRDISFFLSPGEAIGILGPNGAGKTSTFYMVMGLIKPDYGSITLKGKDITYLPMYQRARMGVGYLPQEASIFRGLTVEQNIMSILETTEPISVNRHNKLEELLADFSITHLRNVPHDGIVLEEGTPEKVVKSKAVKEVYLGEKFQL